MTRHHVLLVPFDRRTYQAYAPVKVVVDGRHWMLAAADAAGRRGLRVIELHQFGWDSDQILAWGIVVATASQPLAQPESPSLVTAADAHRHEISDQDWTRDIVKLLEEAYLSSDDPFAQSGKSGGVAEWEAGRRLIADAISGPGTFFDTCCANGLLMENMAEWAGVEPYGLDISGRLVALARQRLPHWADRIWTGDARIWDPPFKFDYVYVLPEITRPHLRREMVEHLMTRAVTPGGRLIAGQYLSASNDDLDSVPVWDSLIEWGFDVAGSVVRPLTPEATGSRTEIAWIIAN